MQLHRTQGAVREHYKCCIVKLLAGVFAFAAAGLPAIGIAVSRKRTLWTTCLMRL
jgi:hypothetical protein